MIPVQGSYLDRDGRIKYYESHQMAQEKAFEKEIEKLQGRIVELEKYVIYLQQDITRTRKALEHHIENDNAIHAIDRKELGQKISSETNLSGEKIEEIVNELLSYKDDLRHLHRGNTHAVRDTSLE